MSRDIRLTIKMDIIVDFKAGGEIIFERFDDVGLEFAVDVGNDGMKVRDEDVDVESFAMGVSETNHGHERAEKIAEGELAIDAKAGEDSGSIHRIIIA